MRGTQCFSFLWISSKISLLTCIHYLSVSVKYAPICYLEVEKSIFRGAIVENLYGIEVFPTLQCHEQILSLIQVWQNRPLWFCLI